VSKVALKDAKWRLSIHEEDYGWMWILTSPDDLGTDYMICQAERDLKTKEACSLQAEEFIKRNGWNVVEREIEE